MFFGRKVNGPPQFARGVTKTKHAHIEKPEMSLGVLGVLSSTQLVAGFSSWLQAASFFETHLGLSFV